MKKQESKTKKKQAGIKKLKRRVITFFSIEFCDTLYLKSRTEVSRNCKNCENDPREFDGKAICPIRLSP